MGFEGFFKTQMNVTNENVNHLTQEDMKKDLSEIKIDKKEK